MKSKWVASLVAVVAVSALAGCGSQPKQDTVSVIDENHFDQLASAPEDGTGNAAGSVEILADGTVPAQAARASIPMDSANAPIAATQSSVAQAPAPSGSGERAPKGASFEQKVQTALKNAGYYSGTIDGKIGSKTREAIKAFQTANGLKADGVVGPGTWERLKKFTGGASAGSNA